VVQFPTAIDTICRYRDDTKYKGESDTGFYLFYCDTDWNIVTDTWHESLDAAKRQARFEYDGIDNHWRPPATDL
jgi:hypothetical protein